jgi:hypothetical protein
MPSRTNSARLTQISHNRTGRATTRRTRLGRIETLEARLALAVWYVDADAVGAKTGATWSAAMTDVQAALASTHQGDEIWIAEGQYAPAAPGNPAASFVLPDDVALYGGFAGGETSRDARDPLIHLSILQGDGYHVVTVPAGHEATIDSLHIRGGYANGSTAADRRGGGITNAGVLKLTNSYVSGGRAIEYGGGIYNAGELAVLGGSVFQNYGESLSNQGNQGFGGGIAAGPGSETTVRNASFDWNYAPIGGSIYVQSTSANPASLRVTNSVVAGRAGTLGGAIATEAGAQVTIAHSTLVGASPQAQQIFSQSPVLISNSILADTNDSSDDASLSIQGPLDPLSSYNLIAAADGATLALGGVHGNFVGTLATPLNAGVVLQQSFSTGQIPGYRATTLQASLNADSLAVDGGDPSFNPNTFDLPLTTDFGSGPRVLDDDGNGTPRIDIGAVESDVLRLVVSTFVDENDGDYSAGDLSLREAILLANAHVGDERIELPPGNYDFAIAKTSQSGFWASDSLSGDLVIDDPLGTVHLMGDGANVTLIDAKGLDRAFYVNQGGLDLTGVTIRGGDATELHDAGSSEPERTGYGGAIFVKGALSVADSIIEGSHAPDQGGGIYVGEDADFSMLRTIVRGNTAGSAAGILVDEADVASIVSSEINDNVATTYGGGIVAKESPIEITGSNIHDNFAGTQGGGLKIQNAPLVMQSTDVANNFAAEAGAGLFIEREDLVQLLNSRISDNRTGENGAGGGIYVLGANLNLTGTIVTANVAGIHAGFGGGIATSTMQFPVTSRIVTITGGTVDDNSAGFSGGGVYNNGIVLHLQNVTVTRNLSQEGGGGIWNAYELTVSNSDIRGNITDGVGGGIGSTGEAQTTITDTGITENQASAGGGVFVGNDSTLTITAGLISDNTATTHGGGIAVDEGSTFHLAGTHIVHNTAGQHGGGISLLEVEATIDSAEISENSAATNGGGLAASDSSITVTSASVHDNFAGSKGGGLFLELSGTAVLHDSSIDHNRVADGGMGGGIYLSGTSASLTGTTVTANSAGPTSGRGGGIATNTLASPVSAQLVTITDGTIDGNTASDAGGGILNNGVALALQNVRIAHNHATNGGGGVWNADRLTVSQSFIRNNVAGSDGGGIGTANEAQTTITDTRLTENEASAGAGIFSGEDSTLTVTGGLINDNSALVYGGGIAVDEGSAIHLNGAHIVSNHAGRYGGGIALDEVNATLDSVEITDNTADEDGAGVYVNDVDSFHLTGSVLTENVAGSIGRGGGLFVRIGKNVAISNTTISRNSAGSGGGMYLQSLGTAAAPGTIADSQIQDNTATSGAGIYVNVNSYLTVAGSTIHDNAAAQSGAGLVNDSGNVRIEHSSVQSNRVTAAATSDIETHQGAGISNQATQAAATLTLLDAQLTNNQVDVQTTNKAYAYGGAIANVGGAFLASLSADLSRFEGNTARATGFEDTDAEVNAFGGAIYNAGLASLTVNRTTLQGNTAEAGDPQVDTVDSASGGAIYTNASATVTIDASTIAANHARALGDDNGQQVRGGGIAYVGASSNSRLDIRSSTISLNDATSGQEDAEVIGGGISFENSGLGQVTLQYSTITHNASQRIRSEDGYALGGGIGLSPLSSNRPILYSTLIAGNQAETGPDLNGLFTSSGYNLIGIGAAANSQSGDLIGTTQAPINPRLDTLAFNGGPTQTHALLAGSPAINAGNPDAQLQTQPTDQRGQPRIVDGRMDIGSFESSIFLFGDLDGNGRVDLRDVMAIQRNLGNVSPTYATGDLNADGRVDRADVAAATHQLGKTGVASSPAAIIARKPNSATATAEPTTTRPTLTAAAVDRALTELRATRRTLPGTQNIATSTAGDLASAGAMGASLSASRRATTATIARRR